jgi:hypothetical protein
VRLLTLEYISRLIHPIHHPSAFPGAIWSFLASSFAGCRRAGEAQAVPIPNFHIIWSHMASHASDLAGILRLSIGIIVTDSCTSFGLGIKIRNVS